MELQHIRDLLESYIHKDGIAEEEWSEGERLAALQGLVALTERYQNLLSEYNRALEDLSAIGTAETLLGGLSLSSQTTSAPCIAIETLYEGQQARLRTLKHSLELFSTTKDFKETSNG